MRIPETVTGEFEAGNPATGKPGSMLTSLLMNSWLRELIGVLREAGINVDPADDGQLAKAILAIVAARTKAASEQVDGLIRIATAEQALAMTDDTVAMTPAKLAAAFMGASQSLGPRGHQIFPGGMILQWDSVSVPPNGRQFDANLPIAFPRRISRAFCCADGWLQIPAGLGIRATSKTQVSLWNSAQNYLQVAYFVIGE